MTFFFLLSSHSPSLSLTSCSYSCTWVRPRGQGGQKRGKRAKRPHLMGLTLSYPHSNIYSWLSWDFSETPDAILQYGDVIFWNSLIPLSVTFRISCLLPALKTPATGPGAVAHICNSSYLGGKKIEAWSLSGQKHKILSEKQTQIQKDKGAWFKW
jgi:hypothetical protein